MGTFVRKQRVANISIEGGDYDGLELKLSLSISMGDFIDFQKKRWGMEATIESQEEAMEWFADNVLISWNYAEEEGGEPLPCNYESMMTLEPALFLEVVRRWREAVTEIDVPLVSPSPSGTPSAAVSTGTATRSRSRRKR